VRLCRRQVFRLSRAIIYSAGGCFSPGARKRSGRSGENLGEVPRTPAWAGRLAWGPPLLGPHSRNIPATVKRETSARQRKGAREMPLAGATAQGRARWGSNARETMGWDISRGRSPRVGACRSCVRASVRVAPPRGRGGRRRALTRRVYPGSRGDQCDGARDGNLRLRADRQSLGPGVRGVDGPDAGARDGDAPRARVPRRLRGPAPARVDTPMTKRTLRTGAEMLAQGALFERPHPVGTRSPRR
jgi:hypothetical protein